MLHARAVNIRCDGHYSTFWDFGLEVNMDSDEELQISIKERSQNPAGMAQTPRRKGEVER